MAKPDATDWADRVDPEETRRREVKQYRKILKVREDYPDAKLRHFLACSQEELERIRTASNLLK